MLLVKRSLSREIVSGPVTGKEYVFFTRWNVCASEVEDADIPKLLEVKYSCCGRPPSGLKFHKASEEERSRWYQ